MTTTKLLLAAGLLLSCGGQPASSTPESNPEPVSTQSAPSTSKSERKVVTTTKVEILEDITFSEGATLAETSNPIIEAIATTLAGNLEIELVGVEAHAAEQELAERRGQAVIDAHVNQGVDVQRLKNQSIVADNDKVEFIIVRRTSETEK